MGLTLKQEIAEREYKKYEKLTDSFTFEEGKTYSLASMDRLSSKVLTHIWERKQILKDVVAYYKEGTESKEKEDALQKRLNENDEYFMNLTAIDKEKFIEFFEHTSDKLAKIPAWQSPKQQQKSSICQTLIRRIRLFLCRAEWQSDILLRLTKGPKKQILACVL